MEYIVTDPAAINISPSPAYVEETMEYAYPTPVMPQMDRRMMQNDDAIFAGAIITSIIAAIWAIIMIPFAILSVIGMWKTFTKAGQPGWASIIPIYNWYIMIKIAGRPSWWLLLFFLPVANIVVTVILAIDTAKAFGRDAVFGVVGLWLLPLIGYLVLAFNKDKYKGVPVHENQ